MLRQLCALVLVVGALVSSSACLSQPGVGRAANPGAAQGPAPWGSATSNDEMSKKVALLNDILDKKLEIIDLPARVESDFKTLSTEQREKALAGLKDLLDNLSASGKLGKTMAPGPDRDMLIAQLYFGDRRFIEAATLLSKILDANPIYPEARNLLARCFFFLGNRDRTIDELTYVLTNPQQKAQPEERLDALFLLGAAVSETPGMSRENMQKGFDAWTEYLKIAPESPQRPHVEEGLKDIAAGLKGEGRLAQPLVPVQPNGGGGGGGGEPAPMGPGSQPVVPKDPSETRVAKLAKNATPYDKALAAGLDGLEAKDFNAAEPALKEALKLKPGSPEASVGLGRVYVQSGRFPEALAIFDATMKANPDYMPAFHYNGMANMMSGKPAEAVKSWQHILDKDPAYAAKFTLDRRIEMAKRMSQGQ